jgi:Zn-dependent protease
MLITYLFENPLFFFLIALSLIISITVHEFAHAITAYKLGDSTPKLQGRVTLNPLAHLDPIGSLLILIAGFGWGRPVEFDVYNLRSPKRDVALIAFAGPLTNFIFGILFFLLGGFFADFKQAFHFIALINFILGFFNLLPIYPLDGFNIVTGILPFRLAIEWRETSNYGFIILLAFVFLGLSQYTVIPAANFLMFLLSSLTGF